MYNKCLGCKNEVLTPFSRTIVSIDTNLVAPESKLNYTTYDLFCLNQKLSIYLNTVKKGYNPKLISKEINGRMHLVVEVYDGSEKIEMGKDFIEKLSNEVANALANNPRSVPILTPFGNGYPEFWVRGVLPYLDINPSLNPFIYESNLYLEFFEEDDYYTQYDNLFDNLQNQLKGLYQSGAIITNSSFAENWDLLPVDTITFESIDQLNKELKEDRMDISNGTNNKIETLMMESSREILNRKSPPPGYPNLEPTQKRNDVKIENYHLPGNPLSYQTIAKASVLTGYPGGFSEEILERDNQDDYDNRVQTYYDNQSYGLYIPRWNDLRITQDRVAFLTQKMAKDFTFSLSIPTEGFNVSAHYITENLNNYFKKMKSEERKSEERKEERNSEIPIFEGNDLILSSDNLKRIQEIASIVQNSLTYSGRVAAIPISTFEQGEEYRRGAKVAYPDQKSVIYATYDPIKPLVFSITIPPYENQLFVGENIRNNISKKRFI